MAMKSETYPKTLAKWKFSRGKYISNYKYTYSEVCGCLLGDTSRGHSCCFFEVEKCFENRGRNHIRPLAYKFLADAFE